MYSLLVWQWWVEPVEGVREKWWKLLRNQVIRSKSFELKVSLRLDLYAID
jgi:hypothetical protein